MAKTYRTMKEILDAVPTDAPEEDPFLGFYTEQQLADRWGKEIHTIRKWRAARDMGLPPAFIPKRGQYVTALYPKRWVWLFEMERMFR